MERRGSDVIQRKELRIFIERLQNKEMSNITSKNLMDPVINYSNIYIGECNNSKKEKEKRRKKKKRKETKENTTIFLFF